MTPSELLEYFEILQEAPPITSALEASLRARGSLNPKVWYRSQKEHLTGWLSQYDGPGAYGRMVHSGRTAAFAYNHIMCPPMALWLGEAVGIPVEIVQRAADAVLAAGPRLPAQNGALRAIIPWSMIEEQLAKLPQPTATAARTIVQPKSKPLPPPNRPLQRVSMFKK